MNKGSIVERLCSDLDRKEPRYKWPTLLYFTNPLSRRPHGMTGSPPVTPYKARYKVRTLWNEAIACKILNDDRGLTFSWSNHRTVLLYRRHDGVPVSSGKLVKPPVSRETFMLSPLERNAVHESCSCDQFNTQKQPSPQLHFMLKAYINGCHTLQVGL